MRKKTIGLNRRQLFAASAAAGAALALKAPAASAAVPAMPFKPTPIPQWAPYKDGIAEINGARLYYRDSGGTGTPLLLMHPATGSASVWSYQQPVFVKAGYRVIAYSRRGYLGSDPADKNNGGIASQDMGAMMDFLGVGKFAAVASAAGSTIVLDYAMDHSDRMLAIVVAGGSYGEVEEPEIQELRKATRVKGFDEMPGYFRELGPSYRAADLEGTKLWAELEEKAVNGNRLGPKNANKFSWATLGKIKAPTLFIAGGSDLAAPATMMRVVVPHVPNADMVVMHDVGHSTYWEQPAEFNKIVLDFLRKHIKK